MEKADDLLTTWKCGRTALIRMTLPKSLGLETLSGLGVGGSQEGTSTGWCLS